MKKLLAIIMLCALGTTGYSNTIPTQSGTGYSISLIFNSGGLMKLYKGLDPKILQSGDEAAIEKYLVPFNPQIVDYVKEQYGENLTDYFDIDDQMLFFSGFLIAHFEIYQGIPGQEAKMEPGEIMECIGAAIGLGRGVKELVTGYTQLINGTATFNTVFSIVKNIIRRYAGWFAVGYAIYKFGDCMDWW